MTLPPASPSLNLVAYFTVMGSCVRATNVVSMTAVAVVSGAMVDAVVASPDAVVAITVSASPARLHEAMAIARAATSANPTINPFFTARPPCDLPCGSLSPPWD